MIPETAANVTKSEPFPQTRINAHEVYSELSSIYLQNSELLKINTHFADSRKAETVTNDIEKSREEIKSLLIQYAYRGCNIAYSN